MFVSAKKGWVKRGSPVMKQSCTKLCQNTIYVMAGCVHSILNQTGRKTNSAQWWQIAFRVRDSRNCESVAGESHRSPTSPKPSRRKSN